MKKTSFILISALSIVALASCTKELISPDEASDLKTTTVTLTLDPATKTSLDGGKTVWNAGDKILLTDGTNIDTLKVTAADAGTSTATLTSISFTAETVYAIYPATAYKSVTDGKVNIKVVADQSGEFKDANICVASASDYKFKMKNATAVMKVTTPADGLYVVFNASGDALASNLAVSFEADGSIASEEASGSTGIVTMEAPTAGDYYVAVAPGTYKAGFSIMAISQEDGKFQSKATKSSKTLAINDMADLGTIGDDLSGFEGTGTEADPYQIKTLGEMIALANSVNVGKTYAGEYLKVMNSISGVTLPVGYYNSESKKHIAFRGDFNGNAQEITLAIDGANCKSNSFLGLFGDVAKGANIHDVIVSGTVTGTGNYIAGIAGCVHADSTATTISNCTNKATVNGNSDVAGIVGYIDGKIAKVISIDNCNNTGAITGTANNIGGIAGIATNSGQFTQTISNCSNSASVTGKYSVGGIVGYDYFFNVASSSNTGTVEGTVSCGRYLGYPGAWRFANLDGSDNQGNYSFLEVSIRGVGGIVGYAQNSTVSQSTNSGAVTGINKVGGILGTGYWSNTSSCINNGKISGSDCCVGGITGWAYTQGSSKNDTNNGAVSGKCMVGGIMGYANGGLSNYSIYLSGDKNTADVFAEGGQNVNENYTFYNVSGAGGILGGSREFSNGTKYGITCVTGCENSGNISGNGTAVGGIIGFSARPRNGVYTGYAQKSKNTGSITGLTHVGGIVGLMFHRYTSEIFRVSDCENSGDVLSTSTTATSWICAGGIIGYESSLYPVCPTDDTPSASADGYQSTIYNDVNTGKVTYSSELATAPYVGGIIGYMVQSKIANVYNSGKVSLAAGTAAEGASNYIGAIAGFIKAQSSLDYAYYSAEAYDKPIGTYNDSNWQVTLGDNVASVDEVGDLSSTLTIYSTDCSTVVDALNAWVTNNSGYYSWVEGPAFKKD